MHHLSGPVKECIDACLDCYRTCLSEAMSHCLETGGDHVAPEHFRMMISCAEICRTAAHLMLAHSAFDEAVCRQCADICDACAKDCERLGDMQECVDACHRCADACRSMAEQREAA